LDVKNFSNKILLFNDYSAGAHDHAGARIVSWSIDTTKNGSGETEKKT
jgi:hypothetical protein